MNLILHIGMQRTGTSFLQLNVFPNIKEINLVDFDIFDNRVAGNFEIKKILSNIENYSYETITKKIYNRFEKDKINLISEENIYCKMAGKEDNRKLKIVKIKEYFPDAKIIFGIRERETALVSWYIKYIMTGGKADFKDYINKINNIEKINYSPYIDFLYELFGKKNVYIYKFEDLKKDENNFVKGICNFVGVPVPDFKRKKRNVAYNLNQLKLALFLNRFLDNHWNKRIFPLHKYYKIKGFAKSKIFNKIPGKKVSIQDLRINEF